MNDASRHFRYSLLFCQQLYSGQGLTAEMSVQVVEIVEWQGQVMNRGFRDHIGFAVEYSSGIKHKLISNICCWNVGTLEQSLCASLQKHCIVSM